MGGTNGYCRPVQPTDGRMSSWTAHTNRGVPSVEPGTDYYCPIGTPIRAAASGQIVDIGTSIQPATGFYVTIDLDDGRRVRYLHLSRIDVHVGKRVQWGEQVALSGATGYGEWDWSWNVAGTGGAHVHMTLWAQQRYVFGRYATLDPELYMSSSQGGSNSAPIIESEEDDIMGYYFYDATNANRPYRFFNEARGKSRVIPKAEWDARRAISDTKGGVKVDLVPVSKNWYDKIAALGEY